MALQDQLTYRFCDARATQSVTCKENRNKADPNENKGLNYDNPQGSRRVEVVLQVKVKECAGSYTHQRTKSDVDRYSLAFVLKRIRDHEDQVDAQTHIQTETRDGRGVLHDT